jgi:hypothetical protein
MTRVTNKEEAMAQFMLFLRGGEGSSTNLSPAEAEALRAPYSRWAGKLAQESKLVNADEIDGQFYRLSRPNGHVVTEGPLPETTDGIGGYFLIRVDTEQEALDIAQVCPILDRGGVVELHRIVE